MRRYLVGITYSRELKIKPTMKYNFIPVRITKKQNREEGKEVRKERREEGRKEGKKEKLGTVHRNVK
jgi:hypothetical protein